MLLLKYTLQSIKYNKTVFVVYAFKIEEDNKNFNIYCDSKIYTANSNYIGKCCMLQAFIFLWISGAEFRDWPERLSLISRIDCSCFAVSTPPRITDRPQAIWPKWF